MMILYHKEKLNLYSIAYVKELGQHLINYGRISSKTMET